MQRLMRELIHAHAGRPAVIVGGGESVQEQLLRCPDTAIHISANQHGCLARACDYIFCADAIEDKVFTRSDKSLYTLRVFGVPIISPRPSADYWLFDQTLASSGVMAAWCAWVMGCAPIILVGMDCYQGGTYWHDKSALSSGRGIPLHRHIARWTALLNQAPGGQFRSMGGPLVGLMRLYDTHETGVSPPPRALLESKLAGVQVQFTRPCADIVTPRMFQPGDRTELSRRMAKKCVAAKVAEYLEEVAA